MAPEPIPRAAGAVTLASPRRGAAPARAGSGAVTASQGCYRRARGVTAEPGLSPCRGCHRGARGCQPRVPPGAAPPWPVPNSPSGRSGARFPRWKPPVLCGVGGQPRCSVCIALPPFVILTWCVKVAVLFRFYVEPKCTLFFRKETRVPSAVGFWRPKAFEVKQLQNLSVVAFSKYFLVLRNYARSLAGISFSS